jgi:hypothetical protein
VYNLLNKILRRNMALRYEIETGTNAVRVFYPDADAPSLFQPDWPDQTPWADAAEATAWAQLYIASVEDEDAPYAPTGPGQPAKAKPTPEQRAAIKAAQEALEAATTPEERQTAQAALRAIYEAME